jgi:hypothetical protein
MVKGKSLRKEFKQKKYGLELLFELQALLYGCAV